MYRVLTEQRPARAILVPRASAADGYALDAAAIRAAARDAALVWLCDPNNPTGLPEPDGAIADLLAGLLADADADGRTAPVVVLDEAYAEFVGRSHVALRDAYPRLVTVRTASKAYALAGMRVGFAIARRELIAEIEPYRPPGSVSIPSVAVVAAALRDPGCACRERRPRRHASAPAWPPRFAASGFPARPSVTNFLLVDLGGRRCRPDDGARPPRPRAGSPDVRGGPPARRAPALHGPRRSPRTTVSSRPSPSLPRRPAPSIDDPAPSPRSPAMTTPLGSLSVERARGAPRHR